jgi:hypothetical protein
MTLVKEGAAAIDAVVMAGAASGCCWMAAFTIAWTTLAVVGVASPAWETTATAAAAMAAAAGQEADVPITAVSPSAWS